MGHPEAAWLNSHYHHTNTNHDINNKRNFKVKVCKNRCLVRNSFSLSLVNVTVVLVLMQVFSSLVSAGPVFLSPHSLQGAVTLARNIRHLPCISRKTGQEGVCMFAIDCLKANGTHLGTCIDRFYFGSCCQMPDKTSIPQIVSNNIDDNYLENSNFVHPQTADKPSNNVNKRPVPNKPFRKPVTTEKQNNVVTTTNKPTTADKTETPVESKIDNTHTTQEVKDDNEEKLTTVILIETTTKDKTTESFTVTTTSTTTTEVPVKLSTFQTVSGALSHSTSTTFNKPLEEAVSTEANKITLNETTTILSSTTTSPVSISIKPQTTRKPIRTTSKPIYRPRPTLKPSNFSRPQFTSTTLKPFNETNRPRPTKPVSAFNITRIPPYKPPPRRPVTTKKPIPIPPRLNITILPQSTSIKPFSSTQPGSTTITYISSTVSSTPEPKIESTTSSSTTTTTTTTTTERPTTSSTTVLSTTQVQVSTEQTSEKINLDTTPIPTTTEASITEKSTTTTLQPVIETTNTTSTTTEELIINSIDSTSHKDIIKEPVTTATVTEKSTLKPSTMAEVSTSSEGGSQAVTDFPPGLVTWSNSFDAPTKAPAPTVSSTEADEIWSPITPPEGWILISTIPPKPEPTSSTTTTTTTTSEEPATSPAITTTQSTSSSPKPTTSTTTTTTTTTTTEVTTTEVAETEITTDSPTTITTTPIEFTTVIEATIPEFTVFITTTSEEPSDTTVDVTTADSLDNYTTTFSDTISSNLNESTTASTTANVTMPSTESGLINETSSTISSLNVTTPAAMTTAAPVTEEPFNMTNYKDVCGRRLWPEGRIVGGAKSGFGRWPWQISLRQWRTSTYLHKCGAALLNENWAITAAHCVEHVPPSELLVRLGEHDLANEDEPYGFAERRIQIVASHPHFDPATFEYDLALLRFYEPVTFQPNILPVCVPDTDDNFVGKNAFVTGWGRLYDEGPLPSVLQEVSVPVINNSACEAMYKVAGYDEHIPNIFICAGWNKGGSDSCEGDSGGPMVLQRDRDKRFILGGVISWGIGCAEPNQPGVYTRISEFRDWINQILQF